MKLTVNYRNLFTQLIPYFLREYSFLVENGDFKIGDSIEQEQFIILRAEKGQVFYEPTIGIGINKFLGGPSNKFNIKAAIKAGLEDDAMIVNTVSVLTKEDKPNILDIEILQAIDDAKVLISIDATR